MTKIKILGVSLVLGLFVNGLFMVQEAKAQSICTSACASPTPTPRPTPTPTGTVTTTPTPTPPATPTPTSNVQSEPTPTPQSAINTGGSIPLVIEGRSCSLSSALVLPVNSVVGSLSFVLLGLLGFFCLRQRR